MVALPRSALPPPARPSLNLPRRVLAAAPHPAPLQKVRGAGWRSHRVPGRPKTFTAPTLLRAAPRLAPRRRLLRCSATVPGQHKPRKPREHPLAAKGTRAAGPLLRAAPTPLAKGGVVGRRAAGRPRGPPPEGHRRMEGVQTVRRHVDTAPTGTHKRTAAALGAALAAGTAR